MAADSGDVALGAPSELKLRNDLVELFPSARKAKDKLHRDSGHPFSGVRQAPPRADEERNFLIPRDFRFN